MGECEDEANGNHSRGGLQESIWQDLEYHEGWFMVLLSHTQFLASGPTTSWQIDGETMETVRNFISGGSKITAVMKLKDTCSLEEKL